MNYDDTPPLAHRGEWGQMRTSDVDRDRVVERLNVAFSEGRLSKDEYDGRLENAFSGRTYADLDQIVTDLPAVRGTVATPVRWRSNIGASDQSRPSCSATWPGSRSSAAENKGLAWRSRA